MTLIHLRVSESHSQKPVPVKIRVTDNFGNFFAPLGRQLFFSTKPHLSVGGQVLSLLGKYYYIDGSCEIELPPGIYNFEISKGERFYTLSNAIEIKLGQAALRFIIDRKSNSPWNNWISGDARCHNLSNVAAVLEGAAEGLDIVHLLAFEKIQSENSPADISKVLDFSGQEVSYQKYGCSLFVNTLNQHPILGSIGILHSHRPVFPLGSGTWESPKLWSVFDWCRQGHRKKGLITCVYDLDNKFQGEVLAAMILGEIDLFEISDLGLNENSQLEFWYNLLNAEVYLPIIGASGKDSNCKVLGQVKTWCKKNESSEELVHLSWLESARVGNSFISSGSFLEIKVQTDSQFLEIEVNAADLNPLDELEIVFEGKVIELAWDKKSRESTLFIE